MNHETNNTTPEESPRESCQSDLANVPMQKKSHKSGILRSLLPYLILAFLALLVIGLANPFLQYVEARYEMNQLYKRLPSTVVGFIEAYNARFPEAIRARPQDWGCCYTFKDHSVISISTFTEKNTSPFITCIRIKNANFSEEGLHQLKTRTLMAAEIIDPTIRVGGPELLACDLFPIIDKIPEALTYSHNKVFCADMAHTRNYNYMILLMRENYQDYTEIVILPALNFSKNTSLANN